MTSSMQGKLDPSVGAPANVAPVAPSPARDGSYKSWGHYPLATHRKILHPAWMDEITPELLQRNAPLLAYGLGRSYGDSCLNDGGTLLDARPLDRILHFDAENGSIVCEAGVSLGEILLAAVPRGWFLPVTPGTKIVTLAGAIANDVHGKNHHVGGTIGCHVEQFELVRSDGQILTCSRQENKELFAATIGGLGLTGIILWAELKLKKIDSAEIEMDTVPFSTFEDFTRLSSDEEGARYEYTVGWVDCLSGRKTRGIFMRGNHATQGRLAAHPEKIKLNVPFNFPAFTLNKLSIWAFNNLYYLMGKRNEGHSRVHYDPFFYPLDKVDNWNRIYGQQGFTQYQCVVPESEVAAFQEILERIARGGQGSFLGVIKKFGNVPSPGLMSFPRPGLTLALDFPFRGEKTLKLFAELDEVVAAAKGALYPAKDPRMSSRMFRLSYPRLEEFQRWVDPALSSSFWRRVMEVSR
ncbi:MAG: FAD-binding oxidoreductase [Acidobacteriota bacterium]|nr:FAD-binding oxidoreductase [Acidobacteriota bacterium]